MPLQELFLHPPCLCNGAVLPHERQLAGVIPVYAIKWYVYIVEALRAEFLYPFPGRLNQ
jgi:hypothetical protein